jgi:predicted adenylyl cyclase CyaB
MSHFEIEVKSLLGDESVANRLKEKMCELDPECVCLSTNTQLNHYFEGGAMEDLYEAVKDLFNKAQQEKLKTTIDRGAEFSIRSRQRDDEVLLVVKASIDEGTSANTVKRMEFEEPVSITLGELDERILNAGFTYQAKWSREREEYSYKGASVSLDKNAGYGYLAEVEKIVHDEALADQVREEIDKIMRELDIVELAQDRLARMFAHYNANWPEYYGTNKIFIIE